METDKPLQESHYEAIHAKDHFRKIGSLCIKKQAIDLQKQKVPLSEAFS